MILSRRNIFKVVLLAFCFLSYSFSLCRAASSRNQYKKIIGVVTDSISGDRISYANIFSKKGSAGVRSDEKGIFIIYLPANSQLEVSAMGYETNIAETISFNDTVRISLLPSSQELTEVVIRPKKQKYSKKNNPAVELMQRVRADRDKHNPIGNTPYYSYDKYDKTILGLNNYNGYRPADNGEITGKFKSIADLVDTAIWTGKRVLDLSMKEKFTTKIFSSENGEKEIVVAQRSNGIDKQLDENYTRGVIDDMLHEVDIYDHDIPIMRNRFVSPLSPIAADYYKFHIEDTVLIGTDRCVELSFAPHNPESMGFNGNLYIPVDDSIKYVRRVMMRLPKAANVNYVENMYLSQNFKKDSLGYTHKTLDDIIVELHLVGSVGQIYTARQSRYDNFSYKKRDDLNEFYKKIGNLFVIEESSTRGEAYWNNVRMLPLSNAESILAKDESPFRQNPFIYWTVKAIELIVKGYIATGKQSKFDIGPIDTFISYNATEGLRLSLGGLTTANLSKNIFARGYVAYGFRDQKWKYSAELEYSFNKKKYHNREFPINGIRATYRYDVDKIGQHYMTNSASNLLNSVKRMESNLTTYERFASLEYNIEWMNNLSFHASIINRRQESSPYVHFIKADGIGVSAYNQNSLKVKLRWAPGEKFMQTYNERHNINRDAICLILSHEFGPKKLFGSEYTLNLTEFCLQKRFWFSAFGYADVIFKAAKLWNQVQFPALLWQNANLAYTVQSETFSLLNPMEFAMDQYLSLDLNYNLNGLIFNRIPLIKKLRLREVITFKSFAGNLTKKNNPQYNDNLFLFPEMALASPMGKTPYMELGVGIDNILTILRLDYIWRLSYRNTPGAPNSGLRFSLNFNF